MIKLKNIFMFPKIMGKYSKLHFFYSKTSMKCATILFTICVFRFSKLVNLFGKRQSVSEQLFKWLPKSPFSLGTPQLHEDLIKLEITYKPPQGSHLFGKGSFVIFGPANLEAREQTHCVRLCI